MLAKLRRGRNYILSPSCYSLLKTFCFVASLFIRRIESTHLSELSKIRVLLKDAVQEKGGARDLGYRCEYKAANAAEQS